MTMVWGSKDFLEEYTPIYYFIPGDHDDPINLNVFTIHNSESIEGSFRLETIKKNFPLPGIYSFRFKKQHNNVVFWLDVVDDHQSVPLFESRVVAKVLRINWMDPCRSVSLSESNCMIANHHGIQESHVTHSKYSKGIKSPSCNKSLFDEATTTTNYLDFHE